MEKVGWFIHGIHLLSVVIAIGGTFCLRFVVCPKLGEGEEAAETRNRILKRWRSIVWVNIVLIVITGLANAHMAYMRVGPDFLYWVLFLVKFFLAILLFAIALMLTLPIEGFDKVRAKRDAWMHHIFAIGAVILFLSAFLRHHHVTEIVG